MIWKYRISYETKWFLQIFFCRVDTPWSKNKEPFSGVLSKTDIFWYLCRRNVPGMLWLHPILGGMEQSSQWDQSWWGTGWGRGEPWFFVLTSELSCAELTHGLKVPLCTDVYQLCHLRRCPRLLKCQIHNIPSSSGNSLPRGGTWVFNPFNWVIWTQLMLLGLSAAVSLGFLSPPHGSRLQTHI